LSLIVDPNGKGLTNYFVKLTGITIGKQRLDISSNLSSPLNTIVDSGTVFTRLPPPVYSALQSAFKELMAPYPLASPLDNLDTCYNTKGSTDWSPPSMVLHFEESIDVSLEKSAATLTGSDSVVCLAFVGNKDLSDLTIVGNYQHRGLSVFHD